MTPTTISCQIGMIGLCFSVVAASASRVVIIYRTSFEAEEWCSALPDEAEGDAEERERLDHGETDPDVRQGQARGLRLTRGRLDVGGEDQADADAGADGGEAVTD